MTWIKTVVGVAVAATVLGLMAGPARGCVGVAEAAAADRPAAAAKTDDPSIRILSSTPVLTDPEETMTMTVRVDNRTGKVWRGNVNLSVASDMFETRQELIDWCDRGVQDVAEEAWIADTAENVEIQPGQSQTFTLTKRASGPNSMNLGIRDGEPGWGPRGVAAVLETLRGVVAADRTYVTYAPPEHVTSRLNLSVAAGLTAAPGEARAQTLERLGRVAQASADPLIAWMVDPALLAAGDAESDVHADALVTAVKDGIEAGKPVYMLPYQDLDETELAQAGASAAALVVAAREIGQSALSDAVGEVPAARTSASLAWAASPATSAVVSFMADAGSSAVLLAPDQFDEPVPRAVAKRAGQPALIAVDPGLTEALTSGGSARLEANQVLADSAWLAQRAQVEDYQASAVVAMPRGWEPDLGAWGLLRVLTEASWVRSTPLPAAVNAPIGGELPETGGLRPKPDLPPDSLREIVSLTDRMMAFASLTPDPGAYLERSLPPLLAPLSNALAGPSRASSAAVALDEAATAVPPVSVEAGSDVNLISDDGRVPVTVRNASNEPVTGLVVNLTPQTTAIQTGEPVSLDLDPGTLVTARVPVHAVANGVFRVRVDLLDSEGRPVAESASLTMRVQAEWETVGTAVAGGILALILAFGIFSTVKKRRAQARPRQRRGGGARGGEAGVETDAEPGLEAGAELGLEPGVEAGAGGTSRSGTSPPGGTAA
ncbi:MAG: DUF6049 family protein [Bifidobacteriaceae bacterium]|jgi:hypothetical protein|nr:DUF6049 family protein [Bifidobacteriaceae bacterium]